MEIGAPGRERPPLLDERVHRAHAEALPARREEDRARVLRAGARVADRRTQLEPRAERVRALLPERRDALLAPLAEHARVTPCTSRSSRSSRTARSRAAPIRRGARAPRRRARASRASADRRRRPRLRRRLDDLLRRVDAEERRERAAHLRRRELVGRARLESSPSSASSASTCAPPRRCRAIELAASVRASCPSHPRSAYTSIARTSSLPRAPRSSRNARRLARSRPYASRVFGDAFRSVARYTCEPRDRLGGRHAAIATTRPSAPRTFR